MKTKIMNKGWLARAIIFLIAVNFIIGGTAIQLFAGNDNLRQGATRKDGGERLTDLKDDLTPFSITPEKLQNFDSLKVTGKGGSEDPIKVLLGDYTILSKADNLPFGVFVKNFIDIERQESSGVKEKLEKIFGRKAQNGDVYYSLDYMSFSVALVRKDGQGKLDIKQIFDDLNNIPLEALLENAEEAKRQGVTSLKIVLNDYLALEERAKIPSWERMTLEYRELREHEAAYLAREKDYLKRISALEQAGSGARTELAQVKAEYQKFTQTSGLVLGGGKGLSLSLMDGVVDVPIGFNVVTPAYFKFVKDNPAVWNKINTELRNLDTTDDQKRDFVSREIRELMINSPIPENIRSEILLMYRQMNIVRYLSKHKIPTPVAVRSSGIKEDIKVASWLPITTGSQAGQSDSYLNVKGEKNLLDKVRRDWASLFTDRAVSYRDDAIFLIFSGAMGLPEKQPKEMYYYLLERLRYYAQEMRKPEFDTYADTLTSYRNPGSVNLMKAIEEMLANKDDPLLKHCLEELKKAAEDFVHPERLGIDVVVMQMVKSYLSGVLFTVNPATKMAGVAQALYKSWYQKDNNLVYLDDEGNITGTKPIVVSFEVAYGYGENVVGGKVTPDKFVMGTYDGKSWFIIEKIKGNKLIQMVDVEEAIELLQGKGKLKDESVIRSIAAMVGDVAGYEEVGKRINGILTTRLYGTRHLREVVEVKESERDKKTRVQAIAEDIAKMVKEGKSEGDVRQVITDKFYVTEKTGQRGIQREALDLLIREVFTSVSLASAASEKGKAALAKFLGGKAQADDFIMMVSEVWEGKEFYLPGRQKVLSTLGLQDKEQRDLSYLLRALIDNSFTSNMETTDAHRNAFCITQAEAVAIARMAWNITTYYKDHRDIEFAIEFDVNAPENKRLQMYAVGKDGKFYGVTKDGQISSVGMDEQDFVKQGRQIPMRLSNVQARPYTSGFLTVDVARERREVDEKFVEDNGIKPIASGTKGENATHAYFLTFDFSKTIAWHAETIIRLKSGLYTDEERRQLLALGFNPDDYGPGKDEKLPVALYLLEADPSHDPIMRLVDAVVTIRGGDTCHAAIFCREQGIPAVTGAGKVLLDGNLLKTGDGLTIDANNGYLYNLEKDPKKRIPINFVKFRIKPYAIPGDDDGMKYPVIGQIIAATSTAQSNSPIMLAEDSAGNSLTRAEFKGEELGVNVFAGYGYDLIQNIKAGLMKMPEWVTVGQLREGKVVGSAKVISRINEDIYRYLRDNADAREAFERYVGRPYRKEDGMRLMQILDMKVPAFTLTVPLGEDGKLFEFFINAPKDAKDLLMYEYGTIQRRFNFDYNLIAELQRSPWVLGQIENKLKDKGYKSFKEYATSEFYYFYNLMGFTIAPDQKAKNRAYDFAQDKVKGLIGSELFTWEGVNPLVGLRGSSLEIEGVERDFEGNQKVLSFLLEAVIGADENTHNQSWFYVFVRFTRELDTLDNVLTQIAERKGKLPKQIGIMIEVPSDAMLARKLGQRLKDMQKKFKAFGVESVFFSFGTNDYSHVGGKGDREDPRMKLQIIDPAALQAVPDMKKAGYFYNDAIKKIPLIDEGAEVMLQLMEAVVKQAKELGVETSLCGEAITSLVGRGDYVSAGKIMSLLDSFGISMMTVRLNASMVRYDTMAATKEIIVPENKREVLFDLSKGKVNQATGVVKGEIIYVDSAEDLVPEPLKGLKGADLEAKREILTMQSKESASSTVRTYNKLVVVTRNLVALSADEIVKKISVQTMKQFIEEGLLEDIGDNLYVWTNLTTVVRRFSEELQQKNFSENERKAILELWQAAWDNTAEGLERRGIHWDDLQYAKAIIVDSDVNLKGWDVFKKEKGIIPARVKAVVPGIAGLRDTLEGQVVTIDYSAQKVYKGNLEVRKKTLPARALPIPKHDPQVAFTRAVAENANAVYSQLKYHPLMLLAYDKERQGGEALEVALGKIFEEYVSKLVDELDKISKMEIGPEKKSLLEAYRAKLDKEPEIIIRNFLEKQYEQVNRSLKLSLTSNWFEDLRIEYLSSNAGNVRNLKTEMDALLKDTTAEELIKSVFKAQMVEAIAQNSGKFVVHKTTSLNSLAFRNLLGGFLVEQVNPNPDYGLLGAARALNDFWQVNRIELAAFKEVRESLPPADRGRFGLQITELKGTQAGAVLIGWKAILKDVGIVPGEDGLQIGVNISTPSDTLAVDKYFEYFRDFGNGLSFVTFNRMNLGAAWAGVDIYWEEWRRLAREDELKELGEMAVKIVEGKVEAENVARKGSEKTVVVFEDDYSKDQKYWDNKLTPEGRVVRRAQSSDKAVYEVVVQSFESFTYTLRSIKDTRGAGVFGANAVLHNAAALTALKSLKDADSDFKVLVWAKDEKTVSALRKLNVEDIAEIVSLEKLKETIGTLEESGVTSDRIVFINAPEDTEIANVAELFNDRRGFKVINLKTPDKETINSMPLVIARAIASILRQEKAVVSAYQELAESYGIQPADRKKLNDLTSDILEMPLVIVSDEVVKEQIAFEAAGSSV